MTFDTRERATSRLRFANAPDRGRFPMPARPEPPVTLNKPQVLLLSLAIATAVAGCSKPAAAATPAATPAGAPSYTLDESTLPAVNRFSMADLDTSKDACTDFGGYVNGKWLAANPIPGDRTSWGAFEMLDERSTAVQRQIAAQD